MAIIIDGKSVAASIRNELKVKTQNLKNEKGIVPGLALMLVGEDPASKIYVSSKEKDCSEIGYKSIVLRLPENTPESEVLKVIKEWNNDPEIHGMLVQSPVPKHIDETKVILSISPHKDADGFHPENIGRMVIGLPGFLPCTPAGIFELIKRYEIDLKGKHVVVLGRSNIVGKPIANMLYQKKPWANAIVTICHTAAKDFSIYTKQADVIIAAMGVPEVIKPEHVKDGVVVIDVGINRIPDSSQSKGYRLTGDVDFEGVSKKSFAITPVPGGVGPMTRAMLLTNTFLAANGEIKL
jgi:methylenetetrahydrofolate dehydrogenase (NADP+) / methenyltetrahydrofolate cyclohydrolase